MAGPSSQTELERFFLTVAGNSERSGTPERIRTSGLRIRSPTLYPAELRVLAGGPV